MRLISMLTAAAFILPHAVLAQTVPAEGAPALTLELNKLETVAAAAGAAPGCRAYLVANDPEGGPKLDAL